MDAFTLDTKPRLFLKIKITILRSVGGVICTTNEGRCDRRLAVGSAWHEHANCQSPHIIRQGARHGMQFKGKKYFLLGRNKNYLLRRYEIKAYRCVNVTFSIHVKTEYGTAWQKCLALRTSSSRTLGCNITRRVAMCTDHQLVVVVVVVVVVMVM